MWRLYPAFKISNRSVTKLLCFVSGVLAAAGCTNNQPCPFSSGGSGFAGAYATFSPPGDSIALGLPLRLDLILPYHLPTSDTSIYDASGLNDFVSRIGIMNLDSGYFTGTSEVVRGAIQQVIEDSNDLATVFLAKEDTNARFSILIRPRTRGTYYVRFQPVSSGSPCSFYLTDIGLPGGNNGHLIRSDTLHASDSAWASGNYYFRVF